MYGTLFHEAAHQFVSMTGPMVPGWLNEAYASFFEGCVILNNGTVKWNRVPPGRLFPLANRMDNGWMADISEAAAEGGQFKSPDKAPPFRMIVESQYQWGPPWYAPTWGVVYFLYNYRGDDGRTIYRDALHDYYKSFKRGRPKDPGAHFEEIVLAGAPLSPVKTLEELNPIWQKWILRLRDRETGKIEGRRRAHPVGRGRDSNAKNSTWRSSSSKRRANARRQTLRCSGSSRWSWRRRSARARHPHGCGSSAGRSKCWARRTIRETPRRRRRSRDSTRS